MRSIFLLFLGLLAIATTISAQSLYPLTLPPSGANQKSIVMQHMGPLAYVKIVYNSPNVTGPNGEDRRGHIFGELVPHGLTDLGFGLRNPAPWRAGSNENTTITFNQDVLVQGQPLKAGTYGFHVITAETGPWTLIFSNNSTAWGSYFYNEAEDALRVEATPEKSEFREWLTYEFIDRGADNCTVALMWEEVKLPFRIEVPEMTELYTANLKRELQNYSGFAWQNWNAAANFLLNNDGDLNLALTWAEKAANDPFNGQENFTTLSTKSAVLMKLGRDADAETAMNRALELPTTSANEIHQYGRQLITLGKKEQALKVMQLNYERHKGAWPTNVSLARAYSAVGQYDKAIKHAKEALAQAPDDLNRNNLDRMIKMLEEKKDIN